MIVKSLGALFEQLGQASDEHSIAKFIERHGNIPDSALLHEANCWSASQAGFLREAIVLDSAWSQVVDELNVKLHARASVQ